MSRRQRDETAEPKGHKLPEPEPHFNESNRYGSRVGVDERDAQTGSVAAPPDSAKPNRDFADELLAQAREALAREAAGRVQPDHDRAQGIRHEIERTRERTRQDPNQDSKTRLRDLGRDHHKITGTGGGAT